MGEVRLLGPVELWDSHGKLAAGPPQQRCVLAALALSPGQVVPLTTLIDHVWGEQLPRNARNALFTTVSRLRRALVPVGGEISWNGGGYRLDIDPGSVDVHRMRGLAARARELVRGASESVEARAKLLGEACALWRGIPLGGLEGDWVERVREGLSQERLAMLTEWFEAELACGRHSQVVGALAAAHAEDPLVEPLAGLLMVALYRSGRQADALAVFARVRRRMIDEIGDEPGRALRELHTRVLQRDPALFLDPAPGDALIAGPTVVPAQLPAGVTSFVGRTGELAQLDAQRSSTEMGALRLVSVEGPAGVGKTALVVHWAHRSRSYFPDGQLYMDLRGYAVAAPAAPIEVLARLLLALGVPPERVPGEEGDAVATYRSLTADRRMLVVLDNAASAEQVRPLLPGGEGCMVLVTSREQLRGLVARDGARRLSLGTLPPGDSMALLDSLIKPDVASVERPLLAELADACGHLPLALRIAAANVTSDPQRTASDHVGRMRTCDRLAVLAVAGDQQTGVRAAFDLSYARRTGAARRLFRLLGLFPGATFRQEVAGSMAGIPPSDAGELLDELAAAHLLERSATGGFAFHDLLRCYADSRLHQENPESERADALARLYDYYVSTSDAAMAMLNPSVVRLARATGPARGGPLGRFAGRAEALAWLDNEWDNLAACVTAASSRGPRPMAWHLADALRGYITSLRVCAVHGSTIARAGLAAAEADGDDHGQAAALLSLAALSESQSRYDEVVDFAGRARDLASNAGWTDGQGAAERAAGVAYWQLGSPEQAICHHRRALACFERSGWPPGQAAAANSLGVVHLDLGDLRRATHFTEQALSLNESIGSTFGVAANRATLGEIFRYRGNLGRSVAYFTDALKLFREIGDRYGAGNSLRGLAAARRDAGQLSTAWALVEECWSVQRETGHRRLEVDLLLVVAGIQSREDAREGAACYQRAADQAREGGNRFLEVSALIGLASTLRRLDLLDQSLHHLAKALSMAQECGYRLLEGQALTVLAEVHLARGNADMAGDHAARALTCHRQSGHPAGAAQAHLVLAEVADATLGDGAAANRHRLVAQRLSPAGTGGPAEGELVVLP